MKTILSIIIIIFMVASVSSINGQEPVFPSRTPEQVLPLLSQFNENKHYHEIESILGEPDCDIGSGIFVLMFKLKDGTSIIVGTPDKNEIWYIHRSGREIGGVIEIYQKAEQGG